MNFNPDLIVNADSIIQELDQEIKNASEQEQSDSEDILNETKKKIEEENNSSSNEDHETNDQDNHDSEEQEQEEDEQEEEPETPAARSFAKMRYTNKQLKNQVTSLTDQISELRERLAKQEGVTETLRQPARHEEEQEAPEPDKEIDRESWLEWKAKQLEKEVTNLKKVTETHAHINKATAEERAVSILENQYKATNPAYTEAEKFVLEREERLLKIQNPGASIEQIKNHLKKEKINLFRRIYEAKGDPCAAVVSMAETYGWKKTEEQPKAGKKNVNFDAVNKNMKKGASLIGASRAGNTGEVDPNAVFNMTLDQLARKDDTFFDKALKAAQEI